MTTERITDYTLIHRAAASRDKHAAAPRDKKVAADFDAFVSARGRELVLTARRLLRDPHQAEDVVQDVLAKAFLHWPRIANSENPDAYLRRMLINETASFWRRWAKRRESLTSMVPDTAVAGGQAASELRDDLLDCLRQLPVRQRTVLVLLYYEGLDYADAAALMGVSVTTARSNAHRGLQKMRVQIELARKGVQS